MMVPLPFLPCTCLTERLDGAQQAPSPAAGAQPVPPVTARSSRRVSIAFM